MPHRDPEHDEAAIEACFQRLRRLPASERGDALESSDLPPDARARVARLLAAHDRPGFLDAPESEAPVRLGLDAPDAATDDPDAPDAEPPRELAGYRLLRRLGEGGMGVVWLAEQPGTGRPVALKLVRAGLGDERVLARFRHEALALGRLEHPGIARAYEAGVADTPSGPVPFLAMERVEGRPLDDWARETRPDLRTRVELLARLADAVAHAHDRGVIHRDLSPANVIVDESDPARPQPRVLDFGLAQLVAGAGGDAVTSRHTREGALLGTLRTMSPEQAAGSNDLDVRVDVYALGAIGYELLTGAPPYETDGRPLADALRAVREQVPAPPSAHDRRLRGDLETVLLVALDKDRDRRQPSPRDLAEDLRRWLRDEPVLARAPGGVERLWRLARRHRGPVLAGAAVLLALVLGLGLALRAAGAERRARAEADDRLAAVRTLVNEVVFAVDERLEDVPGALEARRVLVSAGIEHLDAVARQSDDPRLRFETAHGYLRLSAIQGGEASSLDDAPGALESLDKAHAILDDLEEGPGASAGVPPVERDVLAVRLRTRRGSILAPTDVVAALRASEAAVALAATLPDRHPDRRFAQRVHSDALAIHGQVLRLAGRLDDSRAVRTEAIRLLAGAMDDPEAVATRRTLAVDGFQLAMLDLDAGDHAAALAGFEAFVAEIERLRTLEPESALHRRDLAVGRDRLAECQLAVGRPRDALATLRAALDDGEAAIVAAPADQSLLGAVTSARIRAVDVLLALGDVPEAAAHAERALVLSETFAARSPDSRLAQRRRGVALYKQAEWRLARAADLAPEVARDEIRTLRLEARDWLARCRAHFVALRDADRLAPGDRGIPTMLDGEIADCDALLADEAG